MEKLERVEYAVELLQEILHNTDKRMEESRGDDKIYQLGYYDALKLAIDMIKIATRD